jgi:hypothetical protein
MYGAQDFTVKETRQCTHFLYTSGIKFSFRLVPPKNEGELQYTNLMLYYHEIPATTPSRTNTHTHLLLYMS